MEYRVPSAGKYTLEEALVDFHGVEGYKANKMRALPAQEKADLAQQTVKLTLAKINKLIKKGQFANFVEKTQGDIFKLKDAEKLEESIAYLQLLYSNGNGSRPSEIQDLQEVFDALKERRSQFKQGFKENNANVMHLYVTMTMAVLHTTNACIATCVEVIKQPSGMYRVELTDNLHRDVVVQNITVLAQTVRSGRLDDFLKRSLRDAGEMVTESVIGIAVAAFIFFIGFLWIIRDVVYYFFTTRQTVSNYFANYATFLELHASTLDHNQRDVAERQRKLALKFRKISDDFRLENDATNKRAIKEIRNDSNNELAEVGSQSGLLM